jgi:hypothetical protein
MINFQLEVFKDGLEIQAYKDLRQKSPDKADRLHSVEIDLTNRVLTQRDSDGVALKRYEIKEDGKLVGRRTKNRQDQQLPRVLPTG